MCATFYGFQYLMCFHYAFCTLTSVQHLFGMVGPHCHWPEFLFNQHRQSKRDSESCKSWQSNLLTEPVLFFLFHCVCVLNQYTTTCVLLAAETISKHNFTITGVKSVIFCYVQYFPHYKPPLSPPRSEVCGLYKRVAFL